jgi:cell division septation protein DedD
MIKPLIILFNTFVVFLFSILFGDSPITVEGNFPKSVNPGYDFVAEISVKEAKLDGFAKLSFQVPKGFLVKEKESKNGVFAFKKNVATLTWKTLNSKGDLKVKFLVTANVKKIGVKKIDAKFSYILNNKKVAVSMPSAEIFVGETEEPIIAPVDTIRKIAIDNIKKNSPDTMVTKVTVSADKPSLDNPIEPNSTIVCNRTYVNGKKPNEVIVEVSIAKGSITGFAKYQDLLPVGCKAKSVATNGSSFSVADGKVKFVWVTLPADEELKISYALEKMPTMPLEVFLDKGEFSYLEKNQSKKTSLPSMVISYLAATPSIANVDSKSNNTKQTNESNAVKKSEAKSSKEETNAAIITKNDGNVSFLVQIGAFKAKIAAEKLVSLYQLNETIKTDMHDGFHKFMIGNFEAYKQARSRRDEVTQSGCNGAFVTAYNGSTRITVQEALMISNQKWFK